MDKSARLSSRPRLRMALRLPLLLSLLLQPGAAPLLSAQEAAAPGTESSEAESAREQVFAPFVSKLQAAAEGQRIVLSWRNPQGVEGSKLVYRSREPITDATFAGAQLVARLEPGAIRFEDTPPDDGPYHYAVLLETGDGRLYELFIPFRNITSREVRAAAAASEQELAAEVSGIAAAAVDDAVEVRFSSSRNDRELLLFRSTYPISEISDLLDAAEPVSLDPGSDRYVDYPIPGIDYYYCVLDAGLFAVGRAQPTPGRNATPSAVRVPMGVQRVGLPGPATFRPLPLPLLLIESAVQGGGELPPPAPFRLPEPRSPLRPETRSAVERLLAAALPPSEQPRGLLLLGEDRHSREDRHSAEGPTPAEPSEARVLREIVNGEMARSNPAAAALALQSFLRTRRTGSVEERAHFYLGQMYYQVGRYREAVLEFLLARGSYYRHSEEWLAACFRALGRTDQLTAPRS